MGILGLFAPKKKLRGKGRTPAEREALAKARLMQEDLRFLKQLRDEDPVAYRDLMKERISQRFGFRSGDSKDPVQVTLKTLKALREIQDPQEDTGKALLRELAPAIGPLAQAIVQLQMQGRGIQAPIVQQPPPAPPPQEPPELAAQASTPAETPPPQTSPPAALSPVSEYLIKQLEKMTPEQAADWFVAQEHQGIQEIVQRLCQTPDDDLPALLTSFEQAAPVLSGFLAWLRERPEWFVATVRAIRRKAKPTQQAAGMGV